MWGNWNGLRLATVISAVAAGVAAVLLPATAPIALPAATGLLGVAFGHGMTAPKDQSEK